MYLKRLVFVMAGNSFKKAEAKTAQLCQFLILIVDLSKPACFLDPVLLKIKC